MWLCRVPFISLLKHRAYVFKSIPMAASTNTHWSIWYKLMELSKACKQQQEQQQTFYNWISWIPHRMINDLIVKINEKWAENLRNVSHSTPQNYRALHSWGVFQNSKFNGFLWWSKSLEVKYSGPRHRTYTNVHPPAWNRVLNTRRHWTATMCWSK